MNSIVIDAFHDELRKIAGDFNTSSPTNNPADMKSQKDMPSQPDQAISGAVPEGGKPKGQFTRWEQVYAT